MAGFKHDMVNMAAVPKGTSLNYREKPDTGSRILHTSQAGKFAGRTTGEYVDMSDGRWWQVIMNNEQKNTGWVRDDVTKFQKPPSDPDLKGKDVQGLIDRLVNNDVEVYHSLLRSTALLNDAAAKGKNVSSYRERHAQLTARLEKRQDKIKSSKILSWKTGLKKGYEKLKASFLKYINSPEYWAVARAMMPIFGIGRCHSRIGAVPIAAIVIAAVVGAGLAVGAYFAFKPSYDESTIDLKISQDLEKALSTLAPETAAAVKADLEKQVDDAYNRGKIDASFSTGAKLIGLGLLGFLGASLLLKRGKQ